MDLVPRVPRESYPGDAGHAIPILFNKTYWLRSCRCGVSWSSIACCSHADPARVVRTAAKRSWFLPARVDLQTPGSGHVPQQAPRVASTVLELCLLLVGRHTIDTGQRQSKGWLRKRMISQAGSEWYSSLDAITPARAIKLGETLAK